jgi:DNA recombination-dependent growth factor C
LSIQSGAVSLSRFRLLGAKKSYKLGEINPLLENYISGPVSLKNSSKDLIYGWVRPLGLDNLELPPSADWDMSHARCGDGFMLRLRIEKRAVPGPLVQLLFKQEVYDFEASSGKPPPRKERTQIKDNLKRELLGRALPAISHIDGFWNERRSDLTVFTTSKASKEKFCELFTQTFAAPLGITLIPMGPPLLGLEHDAWENVDKAAPSLGLMLKTTPMAFTGQAYP